MRLRLVSTVAAAAVLSIPAQAQFGRAGEWTTSGGAASASMLWIMQELPWVRR